MGFILKFISQPSPPTNCSQDRCLETSYFENIKDVSRALTEELCDGAQILHSSPTGNKKPNGIETTRNEGYVLLNLPKFSYHT
jgi:hypothetical protein